MTDANLNENLDIVAQSNLEIQLLDGDLNIIQKLDDEPNDVGGMTAAELKATFDKAGNIIKDYINETLIPAVLANDATEDARSAAEAARATAESERAEAEAARETAEAARGTAETARDTAEQERIAAEQGRVEAETARVAAESSRVTAEQARSTAETVRDTAEQARAAAETARAAAEAQRANAESLRASAESSRAAAETARVTAESARETAEAAREAAEQARADENTGIVAQATAQAQAAAGSATKAEASETAAKSSETAAKTSETNAKASETAAAGSAKASETAAQTATEKASDAASSAVRAESWAVGGTGTRTGEDSNNAKYWAEQSQARVQPDWNQNDATAPDYIKNRICYTNDPVETVLIAEQTVTIDSDGGYAELDGSLFLEEGKTYTVSFDGTSYECVAWAYERGVCIGNGSICRFASQDNGEPFCFDSYTDGVIYLNTSVAGTYTVSITFVVSTPVLLDPDYLVNSNILNGSADGSLRNKYSKSEDSDYCMGVCAFAEGASTTASGFASHAEGSNTTASVGASHAEGVNTTASGFTSHAEGYETETSGNYSHAEGESTKASNYASHAQGRYNKEMTAGGAATNTIGDAMVIGNGTSSSARSNAFRVTFAGAVYGLSAFNSTGADYSEFFEWADLNTAAEDRVGFFVTLEGKQIRMAGPGDYILGIVSGQPCIIGNADEDWLGRWEHDAFGRFIKEDTEDPVVERKMVEVPVLDDNGNPTGKTRMEIQEVETGEVIHGWRYKANPDYDPTQEYIERKDRPEWDCVGMLGVLAVRDDGTCEVNGYCKVAEGGIATAADTYIPGTTYRVIERVADNVIKVIFR